MQNHVNLNSRGCQVDINITEIIGTCATVYYFLLRWYNRLKPILSPVVHEIEKMAIDGVIDKADRKQIALDTVKDLQDGGVIKLNWLEKLVIPIMIDRIADKLPNFRITQMVTSKTLLPR